MSNTTDQVIDHVLLRETDPPVPGVALVAWQAPDQGDRLVQVYVNGQLYDVSADRAVREMWVRLDRVRDVRVDVLAVDPRSAWLPRRIEGTRLTQDSVQVEAIGGMVDLHVLRDERLPIDATVQVLVDGASEGAAALWGPSDERSGFGGLFGIGEFGRDAAAGCGFAAGQWGVGPFGSDGRAWQWRRRLGAGEHELCIRICDAAGRMLGDPVCRTVTVTDPARPARNLRCERTFHLHWEA
jgi:hypothetical protein